MKQEQIEKILEEHKAWLNRTGGAKADLYDADLCGADLCGADLYDADLCDANLCGANLRDADLRGADLCGADLCGADLRGADLCDADLYGADLCGANLRGANLCDANLRDANLCDANLCGADLCGANLRDADLRGANLRGVRYNEQTAYYAMQCPEKGAYIGYKKAEGKIVELEIQADAKRSSATTRKCRASKAKVLSITSIDGKEHFEEAKSSRDQSFVYRVGKTVEVKDFDEDRWKECSTGIHHFITREEAAMY